MIIVTKQDDRFRTYSNNGVMIKPIFDRLNYPINANALYEEAVDIEVNGQPRFDYEETEIPIEIEVEDNEL